MKAYYDASLFEDKNDSTFPKFELLPFNIKMEVYGRMPPSQLDALCATFRPNSPNSPCGPASWTYWRGRLLREARHGDNLGYYHPQRKDPDNYVGIVFRRYGFLPDPVDWYKNYKIAKRIQEEKVDLTTTLYRGILYEINNARQTNSTYLKLDFNRDRKMSLDPPTVKEMASITREVPPIIGTVTSLTKLVIEGASKIPDSIGDLVNLVELDITSPAVVTLPPSLDKLVNLEVLKITGRLDAFPDIRRLTKLKKLILRKSNLKKIPDWAKRLPNLEELDFNGNCYSPTQEEGLVLTSKAWYDA
jgi:hypothetical protein